MEERVVEEKKRKRLEADKRYRQKNREKLNEKKKQYDLENKEKRKQYLLENREKVKEKRRQYRLDNIKKIKEYEKQYRLENKEKRNEHIKQYRLQNIEKIKEQRKQYGLDNKERAKHYKLKREYNITLDDYKKMLQDQNGSCAICFVKVEDTKKKYLCVDHNHLTGEVRKLLCKPCNTALGLLKESQEIIANLSKYLYENGSCVPKEVG